MLGCVEASCCAPFCPNAEPDDDLMCPGYAEGELCEPWFPRPGIPDIPREPIGICMLPG